MSAGERAEPADDDGERGAELEVGFCEHQYRRDVESCPHCELNEADEETARLKQERDAARSENSDLRQTITGLCEQVDELGEALQVLVLKQRETCGERDAAQGEARHFYIALWTGVEFTAEELREKARKHPWLKGERT